MTHILLKARPTIEQLQDRAAAPVPAGMELYLDRLDLTDANWRQRIRSNVQTSAPFEGFIWIVEAPVRTLEDRYFDLTADDDDHRETLRRVLAVGHDLGAIAANIHVVAPTLDPRSLREASRRQSLDKARALLEFYVRGCEDIGLIPLVENIPPVGRMRESAFVFSAIGAAPRDLLDLAEAFPSLRFTVDTSHAALYLNWRKADVALVQADFRPAVDFLQEAAPVVDLAAFLQVLAPRTSTVHVSNASGLLGEGLGYGDGDEDLDAALLPLVGRIPYFVTETLEADPSHASGMRDAQRRLISLVSSVKGAAV